MSDETNIPAEVVTEETPVVETEETVEAPVEEEATPAE